MGHGYPIPPSTVSAVTSADPRHGRWILPLMIAAMVVLTYTFVNGIEPAASPTGTTSDGPPFPTSPTSSSTTLPPELAAFMVTLDIIENQATAYGDQVDQINTDWETRAALFNETRTAFLEVREEITDWETDVAQAEGVPPILAAGHVELLIQVSHLAPKIDDIVLGLEAPNDTTLRKAAVAEFATEIDQVLDAIEAIRETARTGGTTTSTAGNGSDA
jgi:hypothetical protein